MDIAHIFANPESPILMPAPNLRTTAVIPCAVCEGQQITVLAVRDRHGQPLENVLCRACGLVWVDPRPSNQSLEKFYSAEYRQQYKKSFQPKPKHLYRETLRASARLRDFLSHYQAGMRVLDIGAGAGFFSYVLRAQGIDSDGIEPNEHYAEFARSQLGLASVRTGFLLDITQRDYYHLITINHVFEHLPEPRAALAHMHSLLTVGGRVLMEVPNIEAVYHAPNKIFHLGHLYWYNPATLTALAAQCGFTLLQLDTHGSTQHIRVVLQKSATPVATTAVAHLVAGNADKVQAVRQGHTVRGHFLSARPYVRLAKKIVQYAREYLATRRFSNARELCDAIVKKWPLGRSQPHA